MHATEVEEPDFGRSTVAGVRGEPGLDDKAVDELQTDALKLVLDDCGQAVDVRGGEVAQTDSTITIKAAIQERLPPEP